MKVYYTGGLDAGIEVRRQYPDFAFFVWCPALPEEGRVWVRDHWEERVREGEYVVVLGSFRPERMEARSVDD